MIVSRASPLIRIISNERPNYLCTHKKKELGSKSSITENVFKNSYSPINLNNVQKKFIHQEMTSAPLKPKKENSSNNKTSNIGLYLLLGIVLLTTTIVYSLNRTLYCLMKSLHSDISNKIERLESVPGLKPEEFSKLRSEISKAWDTLVQEGVLEVSGTDKDIRPIYVALQGIVEDVLSNTLNEEIRSLKGIIHTPMPATPLCTKGEISKGLVDPSIENDPNRIQTVKARTTIVRDFLAKGGKLIVAYPKPGYQKRTEEQRTIYNQELKNYPNHLINTPLDCENIPTDLIGATYFFQDQSGKTFVFGIKMTQANDPKDIGHFGLYFGPLDHPAIQKRVQAVSIYLMQNGCDVLIEK